MSQKKPIRCAIYTRKSTEEGLDQAFNSLDAQREACAAYILSQVHEGWELLSDLYDDGGFSGGNVNRPGLQHLLADVKAGRVDVIVVYKVDRLTRSLADFAKIVDILDGHGASFVSVTQAFNTTNSMGRLTLNVLLSFAQFEREVTGERIRDKLAASKAKGMWMGGMVPLGYEVVDRKLVVVSAEADTVRMMFERYLALGSVRALAEELKAKAICSKERISRSGRVFGNAAFSRGALYSILKSPIYVGKVAHEGKLYPGEHEAILPQRLFDQVNALLQQNRTSHFNGEHLSDPSLLVGKVWDSEGRRMGADHTTRRGRQYRYYRSRNDDPASKTKPWSVPAADLDGVVLAQLRKHFDFQSTETGCEGGGRVAVGDYVERVIVHPDQVEIAFRDGLEPASACVPAAIVRRGKEIKLAVAPEDGALAHKDPALIKLIVKAYLAREALSAAQDQSIAEIATTLGYSRDYFGVLLRIASLAPDIVSAILEGHQPASLNRQKLARMSDLPISWSAQRKALGFL